MKGSGEQNKREPWRVAVVENCGSPLCCFVFPCDPDVIPKRLCPQPTQLLRYTVSQHKEMCMEMDKGRKENTKVNLFC